MDNVISLLHDNFEEFFAIAKKLHEDDLKNDSSMPGAMRSFLKHFGNFELDDCSTTFAQGIYTFSAYIGDDASDHYSIKFFADKNDNVVQYPISQKDKITFNSHFNHALWKDSVTFKASFYHGN